MRFNNSEQTNIEQIIRSSICELVNKGEKQQRRKKKSENPKIPDKITIDSHLNIEGTSNKSYHFNYTQLYNEHNHSTPFKINPSPMTLTQFKDLEIREYSIIPKNEETYLEHYKNYFKYIRDKILKEYGIEDNEVEMEDKFVVLVNFDTFDKPTIEEIIVIDPLSSNFQRYKLKFDSEVLLRNFYFFNGQILLIHGLVKDNYLYASKIDYGFKVVKYDLIESYVSKYYETALPYAVYIANGPFVNKTDLDLNLFSRTMGFINDQKPSILILNGPLLPTDNLLVSKGVIKVSNSDGSSRNLNYFEYLALVLEKLDEVFAVSCLT